VNRIRAAVRPKTPRHLRLAGLALSVALLALLVVAPAAFANIMTPESGGSPNANNIASLYRFILVFAVIIFVGVEGILIYTLIRFRARKGRVAAQIHGNTRLEIGWTLGAAVILVVLAVATFVALPSIRDPAQSGAGLDLTTAGLVLPTSSSSVPPKGKALHILVNGQQYIWRFTYPYGKNPTGLDRPYSYQSMVVPVGVTVDLDITSQDVVHSWWIPQLGGKFEAVPGYVNHTWFKVLKPGIYRGQCAFLCGRLHARMIAAVVAVPPAQYIAWINQKEAELNASRTAAAASRAKLSALSGPASVSNP
jgi:cytochrome c oxidase subunit 2